MHNYINGMEVPPKSGKHFDLSEGVNG